MRIDIFLEAQKLYNKYSLCETLLEYLSDEEKPQGQKYLDTLRMFVNVFPNDFMMFVHNKMNEVGGQFEALQCCGNQPGENPEPPMKEPKFPIGSTVVIKSDLFKGTVGVVKEFEAVDSTYYVVSDFYNCDNAFSMWFPEDALKAFVEESEQPTPSDDDKYEIVSGTRVRVKSGEYAGKVGTIIDVMVGFTKILVGLDDVEDAVEFTPDQLAKYTDPENAEENG